MCPQPLFPGLHRFSSWYCSTWSWSVQLVLLSIVKVCGFWVVSFSMDSCLYLQQGTSGPPHVDCRKRWMYDIVYAPHPPFQGPILFNSFCVHVLMKEYLPTQQWQACLDGIGSCDNSQDYHRLSDRLMCLLWILLLWLHLNIAICIWNCDALTAYCIQNYLL